jgi:hypothetical protein
VGTHWSGEISHGCLTRCLFLGLRQWAVTVILRRVEAQNERPPRYLWPWLVLAAFLLGVALAIVWMSYAVHREKQERDLNAPLPGTPARQ